MTREKSCLRKLQNKFCRDLYRVRFIGIKSFYAEETVEDTSGKKKSNLDNGIGEKEEKQNEKEVVNNDSRIEKLIDDISDTTVAENSQRFSESSIEEFATRESGW